MRVSVAVAVPAAAASPTSTASPTQSKRQHDNNITGTHTTENVYTCAYQRHTPCFCFFPGSWSSRWVQSEHKKADGTAGEFKLTAGEWFGDAEADKGIQTSQDARFYAYTSKFTPSFSSVGKDLVVQFSAKHAQKIDCGGGYLKVLPADVDQAKFNGDSEYFIMFGPDICGTSTKKVHVIFGYKGKNLLIKKEISAPTDQLTHVFTLIVKSEGTYEVLIDGERKEGGRLEDDWDFTVPKMIKDPSVSKPADWIDEPLMDDPEDVKPADYDKTPKQIPDPEAEKPEDWDDEADGEWEAPQIDNPEYKGEWKAKRIANPAYKGKWYGTQQTHQSTRTLFS